MNETPIVRQMILCERMGTDPDNSRKINAYGIMARLRSTEGLFPMLCKRLTTYVALSNGRGKGICQVVAVRVETDEIIWATSPQEQDFGRNPLANHGMSFVMLNCLFPAPGAYAIEFRYNGKAIAEQTLVVERSAP